MVNRTQIDEQYWAELVRALDVTWLWMLPAFLLVFTCKAAGGRYNQVVTRCWWLKAPLAPFQGTANRELWLSIMYMQVAGIAGSLVYLYIEYPHELEVNQNRTAQKAALVACEAKLSAIHQLLLADEGFAAGNTTTATALAVVALLDNSTLATLSGSILGDAVSALAETHNWNWWGCTFFFLTMATTVGYGNVVPHTPLGQLFTIFYCLISMVTAGLFITAMGNRVIHV